MAPEQNSEPDTAVEDCDLCILGAGIAGLNALFSASAHLNKNSKVILIDSRSRSGGMWTNTYDYVRLHQPHPMFTAGDIAWTIGRPPAYLATKPEILGHFEHCLATLRQRVNLREFYGCTYLGHEEVVTLDGYRAEIRCALAAEEQPLVIRARRCIKAFGFRVPENEALPLSSRLVVSASPNGEAVLGEAMRASDTPIFVVGGGKTGMDTAHTLIKAFPEREINLVVGKGTAFLNRDKCFPQGLKRWWAGSTTLSVFVDIAMRFDGSNEAEVFEYFRATYGLSLGEDFQYYVLGVLSEHEHDEIKQGIRRYVTDYIDDVADQNGSPRIRYRSGATESVLPGSWFVNCTGYVMREEHPYEPYLSEHGTVVSVQPTSGIHILTSFAAYFLTHLFYLDKLSELPLYAVDHQALIGRNKQAFPFVCMTQVLYNILLIIDQVPLSVMQECGLDFDRWYPLPRRLLGAAKLKRNGAVYRAHCRAALDRAQTSNDISCGVLPQVARCQ